MRPPYSSEERAMDVLSKLGVSELPVRVDQIARTLGAKVTYEPFEGDVSGVLIRQADADPVIGVNSAHSVTRQRFTVAHEIAHLVLHEGQKTTFVDSFSRVNWRNGESNRDEIEANYFAAELLMPRHLVEEQVEKALGKDPHLRPDGLSAKLAKAFRVSQQAMGYRLENLGVLGPLDLFAE